MSDTWTPWRGGECPVSPTTPVSVKLSSGEIITHDMPQDPHYAGAFNWSHADPGNTGYVVEYIAHGAGELSPERAKIVAEVLAWIDRRGVSSQALQRLSSLLGEESLMIGAHQHRYGTDFLMVLDDADPSQCDTIEDRLSRFDPARFAFDRIEELLCAEYMDLSGLLNSCIDLRNQQTQESPNAYV